MDKVKMFYGIIRQEINRMRYSWKIYASIVGYFLICILTAVSDAGSLQETQEGLWIIERLSNLNKLLVLIAAFPFATSFCEDFAKKYMNQIVLRSSPTTYAVAKIVVCSVTSFVISFVGLGIYSIFNTLNLGTGINSHSVYRGYPFYDLFEQNWIGLYIVALIIPFALVSAVYAVMGMMLSAIIPNKFVAVTAPLFMNTIMEIIFNILPKKLSLLKIQMSSLDNITSTFGILGVSIMVCLGYTLIAGLVFLSYVRRRINNELT